MGEDKGLLNYQGKQMIEYIIDIFRKNSVDFIISSNNPEYNKFGVEIQADIIPGIGPIGGIYSSMKLHKADSYFFVSCDLPHSSGILCKEMVEYTGKFEILVPELPDGKVQPLFAIYSNSVLPKIESQIKTGNYKMMDLLKLAETKKLRVSKSILLAENELFKNVNSKRDVKE
ncbi:MAG: molybdenum cofactor guanylyltransferase [Bacteroidales bacterium]|nr:molybdenum cofactor guanylyltransferase [Bacteroidales bacterium]